MRIILAVAAVAQLSAAVTNALHGDWDSAVLYLLLALSAIGWALAQTSALAWKQVAANRQGIIDLTKAEK